MKSGMLFLFFFLAFWFGEIFCCDQLVAQDNATLYSTWSTGISGGFGFGNWTITSYGINCGVFLSSSPIGSNTWGLYANSGDFITASRTLPTLANAGDSISFEFANLCLNDGYVSYDSFQLLDNTNTVTFDFRINGDSSTSCGGQSQNYTYNGIITNIPFTQNGLSITLQLTTNIAQQAFLLDVTTLNPSANYSFTGNFVTAHPITSLRFVNYDAGSGSTCNFYGNNLAVCQSFVTTNQVTTETFQTTVSNSNTSSAQVTGTSNSTTGSSQITGNVVSSTGSSQITGTSNSTTGSSQITGTSNSTTGSSQITGNVVSSGISMTTGTIQTTGGSSVNSSEKLYYSFFPLLLLLFFLLF